MFWQLLLPGGLIRGLGRPAGEIREGWLEGPGGRAATLRPLPLAAPAAPAAAPTPAQPLVSKPSLSWVQP